MIVYKITNIINDKVYIGKTSKSLKQRWEEHCKAAEQGAPYLLSRAIRKYGSKNFIIEVLERSTTRYHLSLAERFWIEKFCTTNSDFGYNMTVGGEGGLQSLRVRQEMSRKRRGRKLSEYQSRRISEGLKGHSISEETRRKISEANKGTPSPFKGRHHSEESKKKMSTAHKGQKLSKATRHHMSLARMGKAPWNKGIKGYHHIKFTRGKP